MSEGFSYIAVLSLPQPWAFNSLARALYYQNRRYIMELFFLPESVFFIIIKDKETDKCFNFLSPRIVSSGSDAPVCILSADLNCQTQQISLRLNGYDVREDQSYFFIQTSKDIRKQPPVTTKIDKYGIRNSIKKRKQRLADYIKDGFNRENLQGRWEDLRRECRLLKKSLMNLNNGDTDYIVWVRLHLRKIVGRSKGNHILQDCASFYSMPLLVWRAPPHPPNHWTPAELFPELWYANECFSIQASTFCNQLTDLDVWLSDCAGMVGGQLRTQLDLLHAIADKIAAHSDWKERKVVDMLGTLQSFNTTALNSHLIELAQNVLALVERVEYKSNFRPSLVV